MFTAVCLPIIVWDGLVNVLETEQNDRHFTEDCFRNIFVNENCEFLMGLKLNYVLVIYSLSGRVSYHKITFSVEATRFGFWLFQSH